MILVETHSVSFETSGLISSIKMSLNRFLILESYSERKFKVSLHAMELS